MTDYDMDLTLDEALTKGIEAHKAGRDQEAGKLYAAIIQAEPAHPDANHNMGLLVGGVGELEEAVTYFKVALEADSSKGQFWLSYIDALMRLGRSAEAQALFYQAKYKGIKSEVVDQLERRLADQGLNLNDTNTIKVDGSSPAKSNILDTIKLDKALRLAKQKSKDDQFEEAKNIYADILQKFPKNKQALTALQALAEAYNNMGNALQDKGDIEAAIDVYKQAISIKPDYADAYNNMGNVLQEKGDTETAIDSYRKAITLMPNYAGAYNNMGLALHDKGDIEAAIDSYKQAMKIRPDHAETYFNMGNAMQDKGDLKAAIDSYKQALKIKPEHAGAFNNMGNAQRGKGDPEAAVISYKQALKIKPDNAGAYNNMGMAQKNQGDPESAIGSYKQAINIMPSYAEAYNNMGIALKDKGDSEAAIDSYKQAIKINPNHSGAYNNMGIAQNDKGDPESALDSYKQAIKINPDLAEAHNNMAKILRDQGDLEGAKVSYRQALRVDPKNMRVQHSLNALTGVNTNTAPRDYVESLFDAYAAKFEEDLVGNLAYEAPEILSKIMVDNQLGRSLGSILDLGCGTGLAGVALKPFCSNLEGVDLSNSMVEKAQQKNIYNKLTHVDITEYLSEAELDFDYFICTDVFIYIGDLSEIFDLIKSRNKRKAKLVFSTEHRETDRFVLEKSGRYSHSKLYIKGLCADFGYKISHFSVTNLRKDGKKSIAGGLYLLDF
jgi:predicted TPR repeat methyltransferase